jgi:hypothetical protein
MANDELDFPMQAKKPSNDISRGEIQNDWRKSPTRTLVNVMNITRERAIRQEEIRLGKTFTREEADTYIASLDKKS